MGIIEYFEHKKAEQRLRAMWKPQHNLIAMLHAELGADVGAMMEQYPHLQIVPPETPRRRTRPLRTFSTEQIAVDDAS